MPADHEGLNEFKKPDKGIATCCVLYMLCPVHVAMGSRPAYASPRGVSHLPEISLRPLVKFEM